MGVSGAPPICKRRSNANFRRTVTNIVPSTTIIAHHIFRDPDLLSEVRKITKTAIQNNGAKYHDYRMLEKSPLLIFMYAESVQFGIQIDIPKISPYTDVIAGGYLIPKNSVILINTRAAHTDESIWNTRNGLFPVESFWPRRFIVHPSDDMSGPTKTKHFTKRHGKVPDGTHFSLEGLEGAWLPYGGGGNFAPEESLQSASCYL